MQKDIDLFQRGVKINGMMIAWAVFDVRDRETILEAIKHPKGFRFPSWEGTEDGKVAQKAIRLYPENTC